MRKRIDLPQPASTVFGKHHTHLGLRTTESIKRIHAPHAVPVAASQKLADESRCVCFANALAPVLKFNSQITQNSLVAWWHNDHLISCVFSHGQRIHIHMVLCG